MDTRQFKKPYKRRFNSAKQFDHFKTFEALGAVPVPVFPKELLAPFYKDDIQTKENCTAYSGVKERFGVTGKRYDPEAYWKDELAYLNITDAPSGVDLDTKMMVGVRVGFVVPGQEGHVDPAKSYFWVKQAPDMDWFDSVRIAMLQLYQKYGMVIPVTIGANWYSDWDNTPNGVLTDNPKKMLGGHDMELAGFQTYVVDGQDYLLTPGTWGENYGDLGIFRIPRVVFNKYFTGFGAAYWSDDAALVAEKMNLIISLCKNVIVLLQRLIAMRNNGAPVPQPNPKPLPPPVAPSTHVSRIADWAKAIMPREGANPIFNNPGNLKYSSLTASWGGTPGRKATDGGWLCKFSTPEAGFAALCNFLTLGAMDELVAFHHARTLRLFTKVYACPPNDNYAKAVAYALKIDVDSDISKLL